MNKNVKNRFSIIIPVYNEGSTSEQVISSLLEEHRHFEIIVVDDGSNMQ